MVPDTEQRIIWRRYLDSFGPLYSSMVFATTLVLTGLCLCDSTCVGKAKLDECSSTTASRTLGYPDTTAIGTLIFRDTA